MALATGADTHKMKYGHRGGNHPVKDLATNRVYISSQNHGYVVDTDTLDPKVATPAFALMSTTERTRDFPMSARTFSRCSSIRKRVRDRRILHICLTDLST